MRGATADPLPPQSIPIISTHTPHARCDFFKFFNVFISDISTHTPHARCDNLFSLSDICWNIFLLTHLMRGATYGFIYFSIILCISTHTPHARCDLSTAILTGFPENFYSHTSCEVRLYAGKFDTSTRNFYSHTSCEVRLYTIPIPWIFYIFLLTHLMRGATSTNSYSFAWVWFLLTHLMRGATLRNCT